MHLGKPLGPARRVCGEKASKVLKTREMSRAREVAGR
jgi:hypothetical protein